MPNAQSTLSAVGAEVDDAVDDAKSLTERVRDTVADGVSTASDYVSEGVSRAVEGARNLAAQAPQVGDWAEGQLESLRDRVRDKPIQTLAIAAGIGAVLAAVLSRR